MALHCAATLLLARPGDGALTPPDGTSTGDGWLTPLGHRQVRELVDDLADERVARVWSSRSGPAAESGRLAAAALDVGAVVLDGLEETAPTEPEPEALDRFREALHHIADLHRGETVLVFTEGSVVSFAVPRLATGARSGPRRRTRASATRDRCGSRSATTAGGCCADGRVAGRHRPGRSGPGGTAQKSRWALRSIPRSSS